MSDILSKVTDARGALEKLASKIPGFGGYLERETRRNADKLLRETLALRYEEQWKRISEIQRRMISEGMIDSVDNMEAAAIKLRTFIDSMKTAAYGYSPLFDSVKANEAELLKLYTYDQSLLDGVGKVQGAVDNVEASLGSDGLPAAIRNLSTICADCVTAFDHRKEVILS
jgi:hypothetical protein